MYLWLRQVSWLTKVSLISEVSLLREVPLCMYLKFTKPVLLQCSFPPLPSFFLLPKTGGKRKQAWVQVWGRWLLPERFPTFCLVGKQSSLIGCSEHLEPTSTDQAGSTPQICSTWMPATVCKHTLNQIFPVLCLQISPTICWPGTYITTLCGVC